MLPSVFEFQSYREFLKEAYVVLKRERRGFSFRAFSKMAGFASPNFIKLVMDGQRNLSESGARALAKALELGKESTEFFLSLVWFNQAQTDDERRLALSAMMRSRRYREVRKVEADQFEFYRAWYVTAIRELVTLRDFQEDPEWIARRLQPAITRDEAAAGLELLLRIGFLKRNRLGKLVQADPKISTGHEVRSLMVKAFHEEMLQIAAKSLEDVPADWREVGAVTLGVTSNQVSALKERIFQFRQSLLQEFATSDEANEHIMQFNVQLFPLTATVMDKGGRS